MYNHSMSHTREINSLTKALAVVGVEILNAEISKHYRIKIRHRQNHGNITLSLSPSDINVQRQRERQIRHELARMGVNEPMKFCWRKI